MPLTQYRSKPAVPLAGKYRLIDIPLSNCINSDLRRIYLLTQFMSVSLHRHIRQTYRFDNFYGGFVEILAAQQTMDAVTDWYQGTADAVRKHIRYINQAGNEYVLVLSGDQLYRMDYGQLLQTHLSTGADVTIAAIPVSKKDASALGIMRLNELGQVIGFVEKPQTDEQLSSVTTDPAWIDAQGIPSHGRECLASMGIYLFKKSVLVDILNKTTFEDFGKEVFPAAIRSHKVQVHLFDGYWEDIGTIRAFYEANLELARHNPRFDLALPESPIYSRGRFLPPSQFQDCSIKQSLVADGCRIGNGTVIENSVIGLRCYIGDNVTIRNSVIMGADSYETDSQLANLPAGCPPIGIGAESTLEGTIVDKNCRVGRNVSLQSDHAPVEIERAACVVREGIPVVIKDGILPDDWRPSA